jgi:hypothetical protein
MADGYRRPSRKWCTDTAVRLIVMAAREPFREEPRLLSAEDAQVLIRAAAIIDVFGQAVEAEREAVRA